MVDFIPSRAAGVHSRSPRSEISDKLLQRQDADWARGVRTSVEQLIHEIPELRGQTELLLDLIHNEFYLRIKYGEVPEISDYQQRFPDQADALRMQLELDHVLFEESTEFTERGLVDTTTSHRIGRYEIQLKLGEGGTGVAYKAWDPLLRRVVALKLLKSGRYASSQELARFRTEAEAIARVKHQNVVQVYDVGEVAGEPFIAMEYCAGGTLADRLHVSPLTPLDAARVVLSIANGIVAVHQMQIIHRDLKPANVFLQSTEHATIHGDSTANHAVDQTDFSIVASLNTADQASVNRLTATPKVSDFGLAKLVDSDDHHTRTGMLLGTPAYMAPEQAFGKLLDVSPAVDVYALGAILYECLTGGPPFRGSTAAETLDQVRSREPTPIRQLQPNVPIDLQTIALKCLSKEPRQRYVSVEAVATELGRFLNQQPILARPISRGERLGRWCRRNPGIATLSASVFALLTCLTVGSLVGVVLLRAESNAAKQSEQRAIKADVERLEKLYQAYLGETRASRRTGTLGQRESGLQAIRGILSAHSQTQLSAAQQAELRDEAIASLALPDFREVARRPVALMGDNVYLRSASTTGEYPDWVTEKGYVLIRRLSDGEIVGRLTDLKVNGQGTTSYAFSDGGRWLAEWFQVGTDVPQNKLRIREWRTGNVIFNEPTASTVHIVLINPQSMKVITSGRDAVLRRYSLQTGELESTSPSRFDGRRMALDSTGRQLAVVGPGRTAEIIDTGTWQTIQSLYEAGASTAVAWNHSNGQIAIGTVGDRIYIWNSRTRAGRFLEGRTASHISDIQWSPDGSCLAVDTDSGIELRELNGNPSAAEIPGWFLGFYQDGQRFATEHDKTMVCYERDSPWIQRTIPRAVYTAEFSPDSRWLALSELHGVSFYDAQTLDLLGDLDIDGSGRVTFDPNGRDFVTYGLFSQTWRWPIERLDAKPEHFRFGPPAPLPITKIRTLTDWLGLQAQHMSKHSAWSGDGRILAVASCRYEEILVWDRDRNRAPEFFAKHPRVDRVAVSPDGKWLAVGARENPRGAVWSISDRRIMLEVQDVRHALFSPDGKWLAMSTWDRVFLYQVGETFTLKHTLKRRQPDPIHPVAIAFSPDGHSLAMAASGSQIRLIALESGATIANLTHQQETLQGWLSFTGDGRRLAVTRWGVDVVVWDLSRVRSALAKLGIDVSAFPAFPEETARPTPHLEIDRGQFPIRKEWIKRWVFLAIGEVLDGNLHDAIDDVTNALFYADKNDRQTINRLLVLRGNYQLAKRDFLATRGDWGEALALSPSSRLARMRLARLLVFGPSEIRDADRALTLLAPLLVPAGDAENKFATERLWILYGSALIRSGKYREGLNTLQSHVTTTEEPLSRYMQALAQIRLGDPQAANPLFQAARQIHESLLSEVDPRTQDEWNRAQQEIRDELQ